MAQETFDLPFGDLKGEYTLLPQFVKTGSQDIPWDKLFSVLRLFFASQISGNRFHAVRPCRACLPESVTTPKINSFNYRLWREVRSQFLRVVF